MSWKDKIEQLAALLEKIPQPQSFDLNKGVYEPYFIIELRPANWEIIPFAEYTRLDGEPGKEVKLSFQVVESQKVNITQEELNVLSYLYSYTNVESRRLFSYGQPIGFLLDWLCGSRVRMRHPETRELTKIDFYEETGNLSLGIFKEEGTYILRPAIVFPDHTILLEERVDVLTSNPLYLRYREALYRVESDLPAFFWLNFFRLQQEVRIPLEELQDFINSFVPQILPALDWKGLEEHLKLYELPLLSTRIYLKERAGQLHIEVMFQYDDAEFPALPAAEKSLATKGRHLFVVQRDEEQEQKVRKLLAQHGLFYIQHHWQIDPQYKTLDWFRTQVPALVKKGIEFYGEEKLSRYRLRRGTPRLRLKISSGIDWLEIDYRFHLNGEPLQILNLKDSLERNKQYLRLNDGSNIYLTEQLLERLKKLITLTGSTAVSGSQKLLPTALPLVEEIVHLSDQVEMDDTYRGWQKKYRRFDSIEPVALPESFKGQLRDYQKAGLDWLSFLNTFHFGGILADDMGLGKTIQVIALLQYLKERGTLNRPSLVIVPLTVIFNWESEISRFAPSLKVLRYQGQRADRERKAAQFDRYHIVLMSYGILLQDQDVFRSHEWEYVVLDESQKIKNPSTKTYQAAVSLTARHRLCLTGTPVENTVLDLWAQFNFLNPGMLGTLTEFENRFMKTGNNGELRRQFLRRIIYPFMLRRKKEDVLKDLPVRTDIVQLVEMTEKQRSIYTRWLEFYRSQVFDQVEREGISKSQIKILEALTILRQVACHPGILEKSVDLTDSGKILLLEDMLEEVLQEGHKVLVFSQFVRFLQLVKDLLEVRGWQFEYMDGSTRRREVHIRNFQENPAVKIFLISLKTGGLGLNLTAADYVIHLDPWWNPAVEQQASDRAHRIGQQNPVFVYKYILKNSVEEKILQLQQKKKELSDTLITSEKGLVKQLTPKDLQVLFQPLP
ncbi:MAG TPA: hypothetical protein ENK14_07080 [Caldithrix sp.]|nr:hypothetical protein [Caldithrix sp.]